MIIPHLGNIDIEALRGMQSHNRARLYGGKDPLSDTTATDSKQGLLGQSILQALQLAGKGLSAAMQYWQLILIGAIALFIIKHR